MKKTLDDLLEQLYYSNSIFDDNSPDADVPHLTNNKQFKTQVIIPPVFRNSIKEDIKEPVLKTKKGKNVIVDKPEEDSEIEDIEMYDKKGEEVDDWETEVDEQQDDINVVSEKNKCETPGEKIRSKGLGKGKARGKGKGPIGKPTTERYFLIEQDDEEQAPEEPNEAEETAQNNEDMMTGAENDPNAMMNTDMGGADSGMDSGMGGMGMEQPPKTAEEIGRIFEFKKIYTRLLSIDSQLSFASEPILIKLRKYISSGIQLFETVISNIESFKTEIDEIIVMFYKFIEDVYSILRRFYKIQSKEEAKK